jgi:hypothetical protein
VEKGEARLILSRKSAPDRRLIHGLGNTDEVVVRPAVLRDVPAIGFAYLASWRAGYEGLLSADQIEQQVAQRSTYDWTGAIEQPHRQLFVAEVDPMIVGVIELDSDPLTSGCRCFKCSTWFLQPGGRGQNMNFSPEESSS